LTDQRNPCGLLVLLLVHESIRHSAVTELIWYEVDKISKAVRGTGCIALPKLSAHLLSGPER